MPNAIDVRIEELERERRFKLDTLRAQLVMSIDNGYEFASPNVSLFGMILRTEAALRELKSLKREL